MLSETALRKPGFSDGRRVVLGDGQEWSLPKPRLVFFPHPGEDGRFQTRYRMSYGREYDPLFAEAFRASTDGDLEGSVSSQMTLAATLLCSNYDVSGPALVDLLTIHPEEPASLAWWSALVDAIYAQTALPEPDAVSAQ